MNILILLSLLSQIHPELKPHTNAKYLYRLEQGQISSNLGCPKGRVHEVLDPKTGNRDIWCVPEICFKTGPLGEVCHPLDGEF